MMIWRWAGNALVTFWWMLSFWSMLSQPAGEGAMEGFEIEARESIRDLVARYNASGDTGRFDELIALFAADAVMEVEERRYAGPEEIRSLFTGAASGTGSGGAAAYVRHYTATHQIDVLDADEARGRCYYQVLTERGLDHWGRYVDRYVRRESRWLFAHRKVTVDGAVPGGWVEGALEGARGSVNPSRRSPRSHE